MPAHTDAGKVLLVEMPMRVSGDKPQADKDMIEAFAFAAMREALERDGINVVDGSDPAAISSDVPLLYFAITDYGVTPRAWRDAYIAFEVTSTLAIAALAYAYPATRPIAGVYLVEETIEETVEGYAGFWALNEAGRPVRIEATLLAPETGIELWHDAATGLSDMKPARIFRKVSEDERRAQQTRATRAAARRLAGKLSDALRGSAR